MSNFDFLKNFNKELYELGVKLEEDVIESPRAVTADATIFLETLVKDIYRLSNLKLESRLISFYKKIDYLYRQGMITYIYKNKLQDAYNLRNKIHNNQNTKDEQTLAYDLHQRLFYISKKYFRDFCENERYINMPEYKKPMKKDIKFKNCIICGCENSQSTSNMCNECNKKIENANLLISIQNTHDKKQFTRNDLIGIGMTESESISLLMDLTKENIIIKKGECYTFNTSNFSRYIEKIQQYIKISLLITKFYKDETTAEEIKQSMEYRKGSRNQKPYVEFHNLANQKITSDFEQSLLKSENIKKSMKESQIDTDIIQNWFNNEKDSFIKGNLNDAFILYNELQIKEFFELKRKGMNDEKIMNELEIPNETYEFWQDHFMGDDFMKKTSNIKKDLIIKEIKKNKTLAEALKSAGVSRKEFEKLYVISKNYNGDFYNQFKKEYTLKRQNIVLKHLRYNNLNIALRKSRITKTEFMKWYHKSEVNMSGFYIESTSILMDKYLIHRKNGWNKKDILKHLNITQAMYDSWLKHDDLIIVRDFKQENREITSYLIKRGLIINALKDDKSKDEAIATAGLTPREFLEIYNSSKKEKTEFYLRFDREYMANRKRVFMKLIKNNDFYNSIEKCEISQMEFNKWFLKDQDKYLSEYKATSFYLTVARELMSKYLRARYDGKNQPDAARSVGLSNMIINKWLNRPEYNLYYEFIKKNKQLTIDLIVKGFRLGKSKVEVAEDYDVSMRSIEEYIELGRNGFIRYKELFNIYESSIVPNQLKIFLDDFETKTFAKSLKHSKISKEDLDYYYNLGKNNEESAFNDFYRNYLDLKIRLYINTILNKKSSKIAFKNSNLAQEEFEENAGRIEKDILRGRMCIIGEFLANHKTTGLKLANLAGISVDELYAWYFKGKRGDDKFKKFYMILELGLIYPRVEAYKRALAIGIPKNWLHKQLKKDLGPVDFKIWKKHGIIDGNDSSLLSFNEDKLKDMIDNPTSNNIVDKSQDPELHDFMKKIYIANKNHKDSLIRRLDNHMNISVEKVKGK